MHKYTKEQLAGLHIDSLYRARSRWRQQLLTTGTTTSRLCEFTVARRQLALIADEIEKRRAGAADA